MAPAHGSGSGARAADVTPVGNTDSRCGRRPFRVWTDVVLHPAAEAVLAGHAQLLGPGTGSRHADPLAEIELADGLLAGSLFPGTSSTFGRARCLKVVARLGIGVDSIDLEAATAHGIAVTNTPAAPTTSTAEFTIALLLGLARRVKLADRQLSAGRWPAAPQAIGFDLEGKTLGIVGLGRIGRRVASLAQAFGMSVSAFDPFVAAAGTDANTLRMETSLQSLLGTADVVSLHVPLTSETQGLIGAEELAIMKSAAVLINVSRGPVVVQRALTEALLAGRLAGAGIDVWDPEPPAPDDPLLHMDNVIVTPHIAAMTHEGRRRSNATAARQVLMVLEGRAPEGLLNPEVLAQSQ